MDFENLICFILLLLNTGVLSFCVIKQVREWRNEAPNGKSFVKKFDHKVSEIMSYITHSGEDSMKVVLQNTTFDVAVKRHKPAGLHYETIPVYTNLEVFINNEKVCCLHRLEYAYNKYHYVSEFSTKREIHEVIEIIEAAFKIADKSEKARIDKIFNSTSKSFYLTTTEDYHEKK